jgi:hypothetical protein
MTISAADIKWYKSANVSDLSTNGGGLSKNEVVSGVRNNAFPDVSQGERDAGSTKYRKVFIKVANTGNLSAVNPKVMVENMSSGDDSITFFPGTQTDQQSAITGSERLYGCGKLNADVSANATSIAVMTEGVALNYLRNGDTIRISDKASISDVSNNEEYATISGVPSYTGNIATVTLAAGLLNGYAAANTRVASVYQPADIAGAISSPAVTSAAGTFDNGTYPVTHNSVGSIYQQITLTFTSATAFNATSSVLGALGSGNISTNFAPNNADFSQPYFSLNKNAWGGTWTAGDTLIFTVTPAALPLWYKRVVPAGAAAISSDNTTVAIDVESA